MKRIEVKSQEYSLSSSSEDLVLYTEDLNTEIAISIFSMELKKVGLARNLDHTQLINFFKEINPDNIKAFGLIKVSIIGGTDSEVSKNNLEKLISSLQAIDNNDNIIDIRSCDTCEKIHPNSFEVDCYHGGIHGI